MLPGSSLVLAGLQTLYSGKDSEGTHLSPGLQWTSALQKHFIKDLRMQKEQNAGKDNIRTVVEHACRNT